MYEVLSIKILVTTPCIGIISALLAQGEATGPENILEGRRGFFNFFNVRDFSKVLDGLNGNFDIEKTYFKPYATCSFLIPAIDATFKVKSKHNIPPSQIQKIRVITSTLNATHNEREFENASAARFSIPYSVALTILRGKLTPDMFTDEKVREEDLARMTKKVEVVGDAECDALLKIGKDSAAVEVVLKNGEKYVASVEIPKGSLGMPLTDEELQTKFIDLASLVFDAVVTRKIASTVLNTEKLTNIEDLTSLLRV